MSQKNNIELENELHSQLVMGGSGAELYLLRNLILALRRNFLSILIFAVLVGVAAFGASFFMTEKFAATARVKLDTRVAVDPEYTPVVSGLPTTLTSLESEIEVLRSADLIERVIIETGMYKPSSDPKSEEQIAAETGYLEEMVEQIKDSRTIEQVGNNSAVFEIRVILDNKYQAAKIANALAKEYLETQTAQKIEALERAQGWLETRTEQLQETMSALLIKLETHLLRSPFTLDEYATLKAQRQIAERRLRLEKEKLASLSAVITEIRVLLAKEFLLDAGQLVPDPNAQLLATLVLAGGEITQEIEKTLKAEISSALTEMSEQLKNTGSSIQDMVSVIDKLNSSQELQAMHNGETRQIENEITVTAAIYQDFVSQLSRRTEQSEYLDSDGRIIEIARPATSASEPRRSMLSALAFILAGIIGAGLVLVREITHGRLRTAQEIEETTGLPLRSMLPDIGENVSVIGAILDSNQEVDPSLVHFSRKLRLSLDLPGDVGVGKGTTLSIPNTKIIAGTASEAEEGLSSSLFLLATAFAETGQKTLLLDCDFWHSAYAEFGNVIKKKYISVQEKPALIDKFIIQTDDPMLHILPAFAFHTDKNKNDLSAVFGSPEFSELLVFLEKKYDVIVIDTPPLLPIIDTTIVLSHANQVVYFTRWNKTPIGSVKQAIRILEDVNIEPVFCVATRVKLNQIAKYGDTSLKYLNMAIKHGY